MQEEQNNAEYIREANIGRPTGALKGSAPTGTKTSMNWTTNSGHFVPTNILLSRNALCMTRHNTARDEAVGERTLGGALTPHALEQFLGELQS